MENIVSYLVNRLRGLYKVGPEGSYRTRSFSNFIPLISIEAADRIEALEDMLKSKLDLIKCGIAHNYSGNPYENEKYLEALIVLNNVAGIKKDMIKKRDEIK
jgi:hypothetical protein